MGSHLAEELLCQKHEVTILDDFSTGSLDNIRPFNSDPHLQVITGSVLNKQCVNELVARADVVFHLAAAVGVELVLESPLRTIQTNVHGTDNVLQAASNKTKIFLFSTSEVYGKSEASKFEENGNLVLGPTSKTRWSYAASKIIDEFLGLAYYREKGIPITIIRLFNTVGPRQSGHYGMVIPRFVKDALNNQPLCVYGDGTQRRTFTHVKDAVWVLLRLMNHPDSVGEIFNVGGSEEISIKDLAALVKGLLHSRSPIHFVPYTQAYQSGYEDVLRRSPDLSKIKTLTQYHPKYGLQDIILDVAKYVTESAAHFSNAS